MSNDIQYFLFGGLTLTVILFSIIFGFLFALRRKQVLHEKEKAALKAEMEEALLSSQLEMAESTMNQIGQELHDNLKNRIALAMICLSADAANASEKINQARDILHEVIEEMGNLSLSLKGQLVLDRGLVAALDHEVGLINNSGKIICHIECDEGLSPLRPGDEVILFRCAQEALHNALRHSHATDIMVKSHMSPHRAWISIVDNGRGIDPAATPGMGLKNIRSRMALLGGKALITPGPRGIGTIVELEVPGPGKSKES